MTEDLDPDATATEVAGDARSVLSKITQRRDATEDTQLFDIPSWDGDLKAEYQVVHRSDIEKMLKRAQARQRGAGGGGDHGVSADCDFLIKACIGIYAVDPDEPIFGPEANGGGDPKAGLIKVADGFQMSLVPALDPKYPKGHAMEGEPVKINDERELVVYMLRWNGIALASHGQQVAKWMQTMRTPIEDPQ